MNAYFKFKYWTECIMPIVIFGGLLLISILFVIKDIIREKRIYKFFTKHGYKREIFGVPSFGDGAFYGWIRESDNKHVDERDIRGLKVKRIKELYK